MGRCRGAAQPLRQRSVAVVVDDIVVVLVVAVVLGLFGPSTSRIADALSVKVELIRGFDGGGATVLVEPFDTEVSLDICALESSWASCVTYVNITGGRNFTDLHPYTHYNVTAVETSNPLITASAKFTTDYGTPKTKVEFLTCDAGTFTVDVSWKPVNQLALNGPPTGYRVFVCNTTCFNATTATSSIRLHRLQPSTSYKLSVWTFNRNSFGDVLEEQSIFSTTNFVTLYDSQTSLIVVVLLSIGLIAVLMPFVLYLRKSGRRKRKLREGHLPSILEQDSLLSED